MARKIIAARLNLLTAREVQNASDGDHSDGGGLLLRVRGTSASWVLRYTAPTGKRREMGLGIAYRGSPKQAGDTLTGARDQAHKARELLRQGGDPIEARDAKRKAEQAADDQRKAIKAREQRTLARCARDFHARVIEQTRTTKHAAQWLASLENHVPASIWHAPIDSVTAPALLAAMSSIKPHERARNLTDDHRLDETARRVRQRLEAVFEDAQFHGLCTANPAAAIRRKMRESTPTKATKGRLAALPFAQAPALMARLRSAQGTAARALEFALLTAARTGEVIGAEWAEIDTEAALWTCPGRRMKGGEDHRVHLSLEALAIINGQLGQDERFVFPAPTKTAEGHARPLSNMALLAVLDRLDYRDRTTVHGLCRSTFSTWANETGAARADVVEACLAHKEADRVRAAYNRARFDAERRELLAQWARFLGQPAAKVLPIDGRRAAA